MSAPKNSTPTAAANRNAATSDRNEQTQTQAENERADGRTAATPTSNRRATETTSAAVGAGQPTNEERMNMTKPPSEKN
ncbi:hypothetical protein GTQ43_36800 [Nostoc sp. KVJ3]|uniref:hypothetical protein n=1 Tax=Nostoc sp. KVJ3 TaxID=457945 RepID=UPI0022386711|nr:hypothetical protein [Nostoc sp. KVJ3]MCW5318999.1 hypothetical protein [Nostoc sp. KVJ3]